MAISFVGHTRYAGESPTVTIAGSDKLVVFLYTTGGDGAVPATAAIGGNSLSLVGTSVVGGGEEAVIGVFTGDTPAAGSQAASATWSAGGRRTASTVWDVYEFNGAGDATDFVGNPLGGQSGTFTASVNATYDTGQIAVVGAIAADSGLAGSTVTNSAGSLSSVLSGIEGFGLSVSGYGTNSANPTTYSFDFVVPSPGGGAVDRVTVASVRLPEAPTGPTISEADNVTTDGETVTFTLANVSGTPTAARVNGEDVGTLTSQGAGVYSYTSPLIADDATATLEVDVDATTISTTISYANSFLYTAPDTLVDSNSIFSGIVYTPNTTFKFVSDFSNGTIDKASVESSGTWGDDIADIYSPDVDYTGTDTATIQLLYSDNSVSSTYNVTITVGNVGRETVKNYWKRQGGRNNMNDSHMKFLKDHGATQSNYNDALREFLISEGYSANLTEAVAKYKLDNGLD